MGRNEDNMKRRQPSSDLSLLRAKWALLLRCGKGKIKHEVFKAKFRRRNSHKPNRMLMRENKGFLSFAFDSAHVKYGV